MKKLFSILLILLSLSSFAQIKTKEQIRKDNWMRLGLFTSSIVLDAVGDALSDNNNKEFGHVCNALSLGVTLSIPLIVDVNKSNWYWYLLEYSFIRFAIFDYAYNIAAGLPLDYHGNTSYYDKVMNSQDGWMFAKGCFLTVGIAINFNEFR